ncbi:hypothetical protein [uncultured Enterococcus sp.]|uniref:hypothetical protein n=1 Tax=uncultured Enterococcus sp. TaxID=167972 RepID=UPI002AA915F5|nr:hypothetical protein [uncultured Enterococcus sp.]
MSVAIMIDNPTNDTEKNFYVPVATEKAFQKYWMKASEEMGLKWVPIFKTGIFIEKQDEQAVLEEIAQVKKWVTRNVKDLDKQTALEERINYIVEKLLEVFKNDNITLYIG